MNFSPTFFPEMGLWLGTLLYLPILLWAIWQAPWARLRDACDAHVWLGSCVVLWLAWRLSAGITPGMEFHLLLMTTVTLMFGLPFAILSASVAQLTLVLEGAASLYGYPLTVLINGVVPALITYVIYWLAYWWFPRHFFIYIYITAFVGAAIAMLMNRLLGLSLLLISDTYQLSQLGEQPLFIIVMLFPEAFINGLLMTIFVVYRPQWVSSFNDEQYLRNK
ncbi:energy-coupling factor ABC transporter permease [Thioflexithrix psekupsensis]|uniref:Molecular chaperone DnaJ n=1 Tax=Thioflexithrix psekupsensis TaxID=1570016 RepID=A0A251X8T0_9GAMM|nr:energy-coupling factor ABC transporter permease [Thioflexithrix psekupsensis]OUD14083.1 hypothetical protein TPSD3_07015 [Thioflexithrix psekupsensis]